MRLRDVEVTPRFNGGSGGASVKIGAGAASGGKFFRRHELVEFALQLLEAAVVPGNLSPELIDAVRRVGGGPDRAVLPVTKLEEP